MNIKSIESLPQKKWLVKITPNMFERFFGYKEKTYELRETGCIYVRTGNAVYADKSGNELPCYHWIGNAIDQYKNKNKI